MSLKNRSYIPTFIKPFLRLIRYRNERKKFLREIGIRKQQDELLKKNYKRSTPNLIIFLAIGSDWFTGKDEISGGIISIVSVCSETAALKEIHHAETIMCTINKAHLLLKHEKFENNINVYRFSQLKNYFANLSSLIIHIPEFLSESFIQTLTSADLKWLNKISVVHINVMNQNIRLMPEPPFFGRLKQFAQRVTITTAHTQYCNAHYRNYFAVPIHKLSVWMSPEQYQFTKWADKENLLVVSPDTHVMKETVLQKLAVVPGLTIQIIQNLTYQEYKKLVSRAKWALTFGEGLDGYFIEPVFSGAIAFAVYNENFFTLDFEGLKTIYATYNLLEEKIITDMILFDEENLFKIYQKEQFDLCAFYYSRTQYIKNIAAFYKGEYTYE
jgi:hypothetical protein